MASPSLDDKDWTELRSILEEVARLEDLRGVHTRLASRAMEMLPKLAVRAHALEARRSAAREIRGESATARRKRVTAAVKERDGRCAVPGFLGIQCRHGSEFDHFFGRGKAPEDPEFCWELCGQHHRHKTENVPDRVEWLRRFIEHAHHYDYGEALAKASGLLAVELAQHPQRAPDASNEG